MSKNYFSAIATLVGTIVGAGIFALPFVISKAGIAALFIYLPILVLIQYFLHKMYAEIVLSTKTEQRVPGYVEIYAGKKYKMAATIFSLLGAYGALLAYVILGGIFLSGLLSGFLGGTPFIYSLILFGIEAGIVFFGIRTIASTELFMSAFLIAVVFIISTKSIGSISASNYVLIDWKYFLLPYGIIFFSVGGQNAIPEVCRLLKNEKKKIKSAIFWGTLIPAIITIIFTVVVVGVTGGNTTPDTLVGLKSVLSSSVIIFALVFGLLSVITSFLVTTQAIKEIYWWDFKMNEKVAWALACFVPLILFFFGAQNLTTIVGLTGALTGGIIGVIIIYLSFRVQTRAQKRSVIKNKVSKLVAIALSSLFILGLINELVKMFNK